MINTSFCCKNMNKYRIAVLVPHQDDEVHVAGSLLKIFSDCGADVYVIYSTNGDYKFKAKTRLNEAVSALAEFDIPETNIIFMGYPDGSGSELYHNKDEPIKSKSGHDHTYGSSKYNDYAFNKYGESSRYTLSNYKKDLKNILCDIKADIIFCVDYDSHPDHRLLSIVFDEVMGKILLSDYKYRPLVYKTFAYALSYECLPDFYSENILSTTRPTVGTMLAYPVDMLRYSMYDWERRIRFPVHPKAQTRFLHNNIIFKELCHHWSQGAALHAIYSINGDHVFWQKRTDNLAYSAKISSTSGDYSALRDFKLYSAKELTSEYEWYYDLLWKPDTNDKEKSVSFKWDVGKKITQIVIYGNIHSEGRIEQLHIETDTGIKLDTMPLPNHGKPLRISMLPSEPIKEMKISISKSSGINYGISECEIFDSDTQLSIINPFMKIMIDNNFAYDYWIPNDLDYISLDYYQYGNVGKIRYVLDPSCYSKISNNKVFFSSKDSKVIIKAENEGRCLDQIVIHRCSNFKIATLKICQKFEWMLLKFIIKKVKKYMHLRNKYLQDI